MGIRTSLLMLLCASPAGAVVVLSEVMLDPLGPETGEEFVELYNTGPDTVELADWMLQEGTSRDGLEFSGSSRLAPGAWALLLDPAYAGGFDSLIGTDALRAVIDNAAFGNGGLGNSGGEWIELLDPAGTARDALSTPVDGEPGHSWERAADTPFCDSCFLPSPAPGGSPGRRNRHQRAQLGVCAEGLDLSGLTVRACGYLGFQGHLVGEWRGERFLDEELDLPPGATRDVDLPAAGWGQNSLLLASETVESEPEVLLDTLLWNPDSAPTLGLRLNEIQPAGPDSRDWIELAAAADLILDGLALDWGRGPLALAGTLAAGQYLLVGTPPAGFPGGTPQLPVSLSLNSGEGRLGLLGPAGQVLESMTWTSARLEPGRSLERIQPGESADRPANWGPCVLPAGHSAGAPNSRSPEPGQGEEGVRFSDAVIDRGRGRLLTIELVHPGGVHQAAVECWNLDGRLCAGIRPWGSLPARHSLVWDGCDAAGRPLPPGLYVIQVRGSHLAALAPVVIRP